MPLVPAQVASLVSQTVILLFLHHNDTSLLVLGPAGFGVLLQFWKVYRILNAADSQPRDPNSGPGPAPERSTDATGSDADLGKEMEVTREVDRIACAYLGHALFPLCIGMWAALAQRRCPRTPHPPTPLRLEQRR